MRAGAQQATAVERAAGALQGAALPGGGSAVRAQAVPGPARPPLQGAHPAFPLLLSLRIRAAWPVHSRRLPIVILLTWNEVQVLQTCP